MYNEALGTAWLRGKAYAQEAAFQSDRRPRTEKLSASGGEAPDPPTMGSSLDIGVRNRLTGTHLLSLDTMPPTLKLVSTLLR